MGDIKAYDVFLKKRKDEVSKYKKAVRILMILLYEDKTVLPRLFKGKENKALEILKKMGIEAYTYESHECGTIVARVDSVDSKKREQMKRCGIMEKGLVKEQ